MTWVIGPLCTDKMDTACVGVCPVDCIHLYTGEEPSIPKNQLLIDPEECIDCAACEPACPWEAIYQDVEVPGEFKGFIEINARAPLVSSLDDKVYVKFKFTRAVLTFSDSQCVHMAVVPRQPLEI